ncbi:MAG TPA: hypothetical protein VIJ72_07120, partial [Rhizomicrobium sp.]
MITVAAFYHFTRLDCAALRAPLLRSCTGVKGTILLGPEGVNGTIAGGAGDLARVLDHIRAIPGCAAMEVKFSDSASMPFYRMKVRWKKEIVTMGVPDLDPARHRGAYVEAKDWDALIGARGVVLIDARNDYEVAIGSFTGALNPGTKSFRDFPAWFDAHREKL